MKHIVQTAAIDYINIDFRPVLRFHVDIYINALDKDYAFHWLIITQSKLK